jgi:predicted nuclease with TOPRIM domain
MWKSKIAIPFAVAVVASTTFLAISHYKIGQTASVVAGSCYLPSEISKIENDKATLESQVSNLNNELTQINSDLVTNSENITTAQLKIDTLTATLISDYVLEQKQTEVNNLYVELGERKKLDDMSVEYQVKIKEITDQTTNLNTYPKQIATVKANLALLTTQINAKTSLNSTEAGIKTSEVYLAKLNTQLADKKALDDKYVSLVAKAKSDSDVASRNIKTNVDKIKATALLAVYNTKLAEYNKTFLADYIKKYSNDNASYTNIQAYQRAESTKLSQLTDIYNRNKLDYTQKYPKTYTKTITELNLQKNTDLNASNQLEKDQSSLTKLIAKLKSESLTLKNKFTLAVKAYQSNYKYTSTIPTVAEVESKYKSADSAKEELKKKNEETKGEISTLNTFIAGLNTNTTELNTKFVFNQSEITRLNGDMSNLTTALENAKINPCPTVETGEVNGVSLCNNKIDDDRDQIQDCEDTDCATDSVCQTTNINNADTANQANLTATQTTFNGTEICNNGIDDDGDANVDCNDLDCASDPFCFPKKIPENPTIDPITTQDGCDAERAEVKRISDEIDRLADYYVLPQTDYHLQKIYDAALADYNGALAEYNYAVDTITLAPDNADQDLFDAAYDKKKLDILNASKLALDEAERNNDPNRFKGVIEVSYDTTNLKVELLAAEYRLNICIGAIKHGPNTQYDREAGRNDPDV